MTASTIKTITDVDYLIYMDKNLKVLGYEMSADDKQAFQIRYKSEEDCGIKSTVPKDTAYTLEVYGVNTTLAFVMNGDKGELLFYRPSVVNFAQEIGKTIETAIPYPPGENTNLPMNVNNVLECISYNNGFCKVNKGALCSGGSCTEFERPTIAPAKESMKWEKIQEILDSVPYPGWMEECWGTLAWIQVWKNKPYLQTVMLEYSGNKYKEQEKAKEGK